MFDFIKKFFVKEKPKEDVKLDSLSDWFISKSKEVYNRLDNELNVVTEKIQDEKEKTIGNLEKLKTAELHNPKVPHRAEQLMKGNREAYIRKVEIFLKRIDVKKDYKELHDFCISFDDIIEDFGKSTVKPYHILQEFFANESKDIANNVKNFDNMVKKIKQLIEDHGTNKIELIHMKIDDINSEINNKKNMVKELDELEESHKELIKSKQSLHEHIKQLRESKEYSDFKGLLNKREGIQKEFNLIESKIIHIFSIIESALKKYLRVSFGDEKLVVKYLEDPVVALMDDNELIILGVLLKLSQNIRDNKIELKEKKKEKILHSIDEISKDSLDNLKMDYRRLESDLAKIDKDIQKDTIKTRLQEAETKLEKIENEIRDVKKSLESVTEERKKIDVSKIRKELEKMISEFLDVEVVIS